MILGLIIVPSSYYNNIIPPLVLAGPSSGGSKV